MKRLLLLTLFLVSLPAALSAQKIIYDVDFQYRFDNREFDRGGETYTQSGTINSAVLTPWVGLDITRSRVAKHRIWLGAELAKDMGTNPQGPEYMIKTPSESDPKQLTSGLLKEFLFYWKSDVVLPSGTRFTGVAGTYPRNLLEGDYSEYVISDSLKFYDRSLEGMLLQWNTKRFHAELGLDWMGKIGSTRRERFQILSAGNYDFSRVLSAGWNIAFYHLASSELSPGVAENISVLPYVKADFSSITPLQVHSLKLGAIGSYQRDRTIEPHATIYYGGEAIYTVQQWNVGVRNSLYFGENLMPYYNKSYSVGGVPAKYGTLLYRGDPFYRLKDDGSFSFFDKVDIYWNPVHSGWVDVNVAARLMFSPYGYEGFSTIATLSFNLESMRTIPARMSKFAQKFYRL